jgi:hypothetical protein
VPEIPPYHVSVNTNVTFQRLTVAGEESLGPYPGIELVAGRDVLLHGDHMTSVEIGGKAMDLDPGGDVGGSAYGGFAAVRETFRLDRPLRYSFSAGFAWWEYYFTGAARDLDIRGPDWYVGAALDYFLTPRFSLGAETRFHLFYANGEKINDLQTFGDLGLRFTYRF